MRRIMTRALGAAACLTVAVACQDDRTSVLEPVGPLAIGADVGAAGAFLPGGTVGVAGGVATVTAANLRAVSGTSYNFWYVAQDPATGVDVYTPAFASIIERFMRDSTVGGAPVADPITGDIIQVEDTNVVAATSTASYAGTDDEAVFAIEFAIDSAADVGATTPATGRNAVIVSLGNGTTADNMFLFRRIGVGGGGAMSFGNFGGTDLFSTLSPADYVFAPGGSGRMEYRGAEVVVDIRELRRPPQGFFYRGYLVDTAGTAVLVDTLRSAFSPLASENRVNLYDADMNGQLPGIAVTAITHSQVRNCASGSGVTNCANSLNLPSSGTFDGQAQFILTMHPKGATAVLGQTVVLLGAIPDRIWED